MSLKKKILGIGLAAAMSVSMISAVASADSYQGNGIYKSDGTISSTSSINGQYYYVQSNGTVVRLGSSVPTNFTPYNSSYFYNSSTGRYYCYTKNANGTTSTSIIAGTGATTNTTVNNGTGYIGGYAISTAIRDDSADFSIRSNQLFYETSTGKYFIYSVNNNATNKTTYTKTYLNSSVNTEYGNTVYYDASVGKYYYLTYNRYGSPTKTYYAAGYTPYYYNGNYYSSYYGTDPIYNNGLNYYYDSSLGQYYYIKLGTDGSKTPVYIGKSITDAYSYTGNYYDADADRYYFYKYNIVGKTYEKTFYNKGYIPLNFSRVDPYQNSASKNDNTIVTTGSYSGTKILYKYGLRYVSATDTIVNNITQKTGSKVMILNGISASKKYFLGKNNAGYTLYCYKYNASNNSYTYVDTEVISNAGYINGSTTNSGIYVYSSTKLG